MTTIMSCKKINKKRYFGIVAQSVLTRVRTGLFGSPELVDNLTD